MWINPQIKDVFDTFLLLKSSGYSIKKLINLEQISHGDRRSFSV
jgi:hypothetical protein